MLPKCTIFGEKQDSSNNSSANTLFNNPSCTSEEFEGIKSRFVQPPNSSAMFENSNTQPDGDSPIRQTGFGFDTLFEQQNKPASFETASQQNRTGTSIEKASVAQQCKPTFESNSQTRQTGFLCNTSFGQQNEPAVFGISSDQNHTGVLVGNSCFGQQRSPTTFDSDFQRKQIAFFPFGHQQSSTANSLFGQQNKSGTFGTASQQNQTGIVQQSTRTQPQNSISQTNTSTNLPSISRVDIGSQQNQNGILIKNNVFKQQEKPAIFNADSQKRKTGFENSTLFGQHNESTTFSTGFQQNQTDILVGSTKKSDSFQTGQTKSDCSTPFGQQQPVSATSTIFGQLSRPTTFGSDSQITQTKSDCDTSSGLYQSLSVTSTKFGQPMKPATFGSDSQTMQTESNCATSFEQQQPLSVTSTIFGQQKEPAKIDFDFQTKQTEFDCGTSYGQQQQPHVSALFGQQNKPSVFGSAFETNQTESHCGTLFGQQQQSTDSTLFGPQKRPAAFTSDSQMRQTESDCGTSFGQQQTLSTNTLFEQQKKPGTFVSDSLTTRTESDCGISFGQHQPLQQNVPAAFGCGFQENKSSGFSNPNNQVQSHWSQFQKISSKYPFNQTLSCGKYMAFPIRTSIKFVPTISTDTMSIEGISKNIYTRYQSITCMIIYKTRSFEELRYADYLASGKAFQVKNVFETTPYSVPATAAINEVTRVNNNPCSFRFNLQKPQNKVSIFDKTNNQSVFIQTPDLEVNLQGQQNRVSIFDKTNNHVFIRTPEFEFTLGNPQNKISMFDKRSSQPLSAKTSSFDFNLQRQPISSENMFDKRSTCFRPNNSINHQVQNDQFQKPFLCTNNFKQIFRQDKSSDFRAPTQTGTALKFTPVIISDVIQKNGFITNVNAKMQCITCMKEYQTKSLEELQYEDYLAHRKGPQLPGAYRYTPLLFGNTSVNKDTTTTLEHNSGFGQTTPWFGQSSSKFGSQDQHNVTANLLDKSTMDSTASSKTLTLTDSNKKLKEEMSFLKRKIKELEQKYYNADKKDLQLHKNDLIICGLPTTEINPLHVGAEINEYFDTNIEPCDISRIFKMKNVSGLTLIIRFTSFFTKLEVLRNSRKLRGTGIKVYNDLCPEILKFTTDDFEPKEEQSTNQEKSFTSILEDNCKVPSDAEEDQERLESVNISVSSPDMLK